MSRRSYFGDDLVSNPGLSPAKTADELKKEAIGKILGLIGAVVGGVGTVIALSINPSAKSAAGTAATALTKNKLPLIIGGGLLVAGGLYWYLTRKKS